MFECTCVCMDLYVQMYLSVRGCVRTNIRGYAWMYAGVRECERTNERGHA